MSKEDDKALRKRVRGDIDELERRKIAHKAYEANDWYELVHDVEELLDRFGDKLSPEDRHALHAATEYSSPPDLNLPEPYESLKIGLKTGLEVIPTPVITTGALVGIIIVGAVIATGAGTYFYLQTTGANLIIKNGSGCLPLHTPSTAYFSFADIHFPANPIGPGEQGDATIPSGTIILDGRDSAQIAIGYGPLTVPLQLDAHVREVDFNGQNVLGTTFQEQIASGSSNELDVKCD